MSTVPAKTLSHGECLDLSSRTRWRLMSSATVKGLACLPPDILSEVAAPMHLLLVAISPSSLTPITNFTKEIASRHPLRREDATPWLRSLHK